LIKDRVSLQKKSDKLRKILENQNRFHKLTQENLRKNLGNINFTSQENLGQHKEEHKII